jgi:hypothetical protein
MNSEEAIFHLSLLGMYADGNLSLSEDARIIKLLRELGISDDPGKEAAFLSQAFDRVRAAHASDEAIAEYLTKELKPALQGEGQKERAIHMLKQMTEADGVVSSGERNVLGLAQWML